MRELFIIGALLLCSLDASAVPYLTVKKCTNCSPEQSKFIQDATVKTNETVASSCFAAFMLKRKMIDMNNKTNEQVYSSLLDGGVVIDAEMYYTWKKVLGYTLPGKPMIWINRKYMMEWNRCDLASLLGHESSHKLGYGHSFNATKSRPFSVPYSINAAFKECCVK